MFTSVSLTPFFVECSADHRDLHSFPTRRSSDLRRKPPRNVRARQGGPRLGRGVEDRALGHGAARVPRPGGGVLANRPGARKRDRKSTRLNSSHLGISYAVFCLKKKNNKALIRST